MSKIRAPGFFLYIFFPIFIVFFFPALDVQASIYRYTDDKGRDFYVNNVKLIPAKYRKEAVNMDEHLEKAGVMIIQLKTEHGESWVLLEKKQKILEFLEGLNATLIKSNPVKYSLVGVTLLIIFITLFSIRGYVGHRKIGMMFLAIMGIFVFIFFYNGYVKRVLNSYLALQEKASEIKKTTEDRYKALEEISDIDRQNPHGR